MIQKNEDESYVGLSVHMSQYKDPNDVASSYNSKDTQDPNNDLNNDLILATLQQAYKINQGHTDDTHNGDLNPDGDTFLTTVDNIEFLLDHTKCTQAQLELNGGPPTMDPFKTFLSANEKPLNTNKRILISQKRAAPPPILKKFQAHPDKQHTKDSEPTMEDPNNDKTHTNPTPSIPNFTDNLENNIPQKSTETNETTPPDIMDHRITIQDVSTDLNHYISTEDNDTLTEHPFNEHTAHGLPLPLNSCADTTPPMLTTTVTPNNKTIKRIVNPYNKNPHSVIELLQTHQQLRNERDIMTPLTGYHQPHNTVHLTPISL
jgi:hypothetical protein